jgi:hypothetical protein
MEFSDKKDCSICVVCLDTIDFSLNNYCVTTCNHSFHLNCLLITKNNCPICKIQLIGDEEDNSQENNIEEDNFDNEYIDTDNLTLDELIIQIVNNLNDSEIKTKLIELKNNLLSGEQVSLFLDNFNQYFYDYNLLNPISLDLCSKSLKLKHLLIEKYNHEENFY